MRLSPNLIEGESETLWGFKRIKETCAEDTLILDGHNFLNNIDVIDKLSAAFYEVTRGINISRDNSAPPSQFVYKDVNHRHAPVAGVFQMRHWYKDVNVNYNVKVQ
jgi:hypothetical protein